MNEKTIFTAKEITEMKKDIDEIKQILIMFPFDAQKARIKICEVNQNHKDNIIVYNIINKHIGRTTVSIEQASTLDLMNDLQWKINYLSLKIMGKTADEIVELLGGK